MNISFETTNIIANTKELIAQAQQSVKESSSGASWDEVFTPLDNALDALNSASSIYSHLVSVNFSQELNEEYEKTLPLISSFYSELGTNVELYEAYKRLKSESLNAQQQHILKDVLQGFELSGVDLPSDKQKIYATLREELSMLGNTFAKNSLQATTSYKELVTEDELEGVPHTDKALLLDEDQYYLSLNHPSYIAVMTFCTVRKTREKLYRAYIARASHIDGFDNLETLHTILAKRKELAQLLGFDNYAKYSLATKMVEHPKDVESFIMELITKAKPHASAELSELKEFVGDRVDELQPWDYSYYSEQLKKEKHSIDAELLKEYFPFEKVLHGLLCIISDLYSLECTTERSKHYGEELLIIRFHHDEVLVGEIILDAFARSNKRSGAWMSDYKGLDAKRNQTPIAFVVCNASRPTKEVPSLFSFDDVVTLFHEFGHALHHVLTITTYPSVAGISGVPWDGVELPSQYMEFFAYEKKNIQLLSEHYKTTKALSDEMIDNIIRSKNFHGALMTLRQCEFALWDIRTHMSDNEPYKILKDVCTLTALLSPVEDNYFLNSFGHIFAGGYAAGYYSYKWAEVMAADAYHIVHLNATKAQDFKTHILEVGGSRDFLESYLAFSESNTPPSADALLEMSGIPTQ